MSDYNVNGGYGNDRPQLPAPPPPPSGPSDGKGQ